MNHLINISSGEHQRSIAHCQSETIQIEIADGGRLDLVVEGFTDSMQTITATVHQNGVLNLTFIDVNSGNMSRTTTIDLIEQGAECYLIGLYIGSKDQTITNNVSIRHIAPNCQSHQSFHGIAAHKSRVYFGGLIYVAPDAQKSVALQENHNILLSDSAKVHSQPQLEIHADDVKCNHGATIGRRDQQAVFYMRQRGISEQDAQGLLLESFALGGLNFDNYDTERSLSILHRITNTIRAL